MIQSRTLLYQGVVPQQPNYSVAYPFVRTTMPPIPKKRQRTAIGCQTVKKRRKQEKQSIIAPVQLSTLLKTSHDRVQHLIVPASDEDYIRSRSSKKNIVWLPLWVELNGVRYVQLPVFPGLPSREAYSAGAQGCVAAYQCIDSSLCLPRIALKAVPMFSSRRKNRTTYSNRRSTWSCEWKLHDYLRNQDFGEHDPAVQIYGGVAAMVHDVHQVYFAMELMDKDLFTVIEDNSENGPWLLRVLLNSAKSLRALHEAGIIYCDLKPENILVLGDGSAKFGDFDRSCVPQSKLGIIGGTKGYESPERTEDPMKRSIEDDVWAFGVTILVTATMASSPYSDLSAEDFSKFEPSNFLETQCRQNWNVRQMKYLGALCDRILRYDPVERISLDEIIAQLQVIETLQEYPAKSPLLKRATSTDSMIGLGLPINDLTRQAPLSNCTIDCSRSTASSDTHGSFYVQDYDQREQYSTPYQRNVYSSY